MKTVILTDRDRELLRHLVNIRFLSSKQTRRLVFGGLSEATARLRLRALTGEGRAEAEALVVKHRFVHPERGLEVLWSLTPAGYARAGLAAEPVTTTHYTAEFLTAQLELAELYVALAAPAFARAVPLAQQQPAWSWTHGRGGFGTVLATKSARRYLDLVMWDREEAIFARLDRYAKASAESGIADLRLLVPAQLSGRVDGLEKEILPRWREAHPKTSIRVRAWKLEDAARRWRREVGAPEVLADSDAPTVEMGPA
jgi:hypothetical protein